MFAAFPPRPLFARHHFASRVARVRCPLRISDVDLKHTTPVLGFSSVVDLKDLKGSVWGMIVNFWCVFFWICFVFLLRSGVFKDEDSVE